MNKAQSARRSPLARGETQASERRALRPHALGHLHGVLVPWCSPLLGLGDTQKASQRRRGEGGVDVGDTVVQEHCELGLEGGVCKEQTRPRVSWGHGPARHRQGQGPEEPRRAGVSAV